MDNKEIKYKSTVEIFKRTKRSQKELCITIFKIGDPISYLHIHLDNNNNIFSSDHVTKKRYRVHLKALL